MSPADLLARLTDSQPPAVVPMTDQARQQIHEAKVEAAYQQMRLRVLKAAA